MVRKHLHNFWKESLYRNSFWLILNSLIMALFGFVFWTIAAKNFSSSDVGLATAVISAVTLVATLSLLGFNVSIVKFKEKSLNFTALILCSLFSIFIAACFLLFVNVFSPHLSFLVSSSDYILGFMVFAVLSVIYMLMNSILISQKKSAVVLVKDTLFSATKVGVLFLISGIMGILTSWYIGIALAIVISSCFLSLEMKWFDLGEVFHFTFFSYLSSISAVMPGLVLPLLVVHYLGASYAAYFYIAWMMANMLLVIPNSISLNFLGTGDHKKEKKAYLFFGILVSVGILGIFVFGNFVLSFFSLEYAQALSLLYILAIAAIPYGLREIYQSKLNIQGKVEKAMLSDLITLIVTISGSIFFIQYGLIAIGVSWFVGNLAGMGVR